MLWRKIEGFANYSVSDTGLIRNNKFKRLRHLNKKKQGLTFYNHITLFSKNKRYYLLVHRLVAKAFIPNPRNLPEIDHKDTNGINNKVNNLEWVTSSENIKRAFKNNPEIKKAICSKGGKLASKVLQNRAKNKYSTMLGSRLIEFHIGGAIIKDAAVTYKCLCGVTRTASVMWKELRRYKGKCPKCTNTVNRSSKSLR